MRIDWRNDEPDRSEDPMRAFVHSQHVIEGLIDRLSQRLDNHRRLRTTQRVPLFGEVTVTPVDAEGRMCGPTASAPARWMTADGLAFIHARPIGISRGLITVGDTPKGNFRIVANVVSTRSIGALLEVIVRFEKKRRNIPKPFSLPHFRRGQSDAGNLPPVDRLNRTR